MDKGWIKLHRGLLDWGWYTDTNVKILFLHILLKCNHKENEWRGHTIKSGEIIVGLEEFGQQVGLTHQQTRTAIKKLKSTSEITTKGYNTFTFIKLNKWSEYQQDNKQNNKQITNEQQTDNKRITTTKECKNERMKESSTVEKIFKLLNFPYREELVPSLEELLEKHGEEKVVAVAMKLANKTGSPDSRWLQFIQWCAKEKDPEGKKKDPYANLQTW